MQLPPKRDESPSFRLFRKSSDKKRTITDTNKQRQYDNEKIIECTNSNRMHNVFHSM